MDEFKTLRIMNQSDCEKWINGKKKWNEFKLYDPSIESEIEVLRDDNQRMKKMITDNKKVDELNKTVETLKAENKKLQDELNEMYQDQKDLITLVNKKQKLIVEKEKVIV